MNDKKETKHMLEVNVSVQDKCKTSITYANKNDEVKTAARTRTSEKKVDSLCSKLDHPKL